MEKYISVSLPGPEWHMCSYIINRLHYFFFFKSIVVEFTMRTFSITKTWLITQKYLFKIKNM